MCLIDDDMLENDEEPRFDPETGDWATEDYVHFFSYGKPILTLLVQERPGSRYKRDAEEGELSDAAMWRQIDEKMKADGFFPNVWWISDHGNAHLLRRPKRERGPTKAAKAAARANAARLVRQAERKYGDHGPLIAGGLRDHWPEAVKEKIRQAWVATYKTQRKRPTRSKTQRKRPTRSKKRATKAR